MLIKFDVNCSGVTLARCCVPLKPSATKSDLLTAIRAVNSLDEKCLLISLVFSAENCVNAVDHFDQVFN